MKVIEEGNCWGIKCKCTGAGNGGGGCNSLLFIEEDDIYITSSTDYIGDTDYFYTFRCPVCNAETDINKAEVPYRIRSKKLDRYRNR